MGWIIWVGGYLILLALVLAWNYAAHYSPRWTPTPPKAERRVPTGAGDTRRDAERRRPNRRLSRLLTDRNRKGETQMQSTCPKCGIHDEIYVRAPEGLVCRRCAG